MKVSSLSYERLAVPVGLGWVVIVAGGAALFATYWDEAWHTDVGRDSAWIAPHLLLYGAMALAGAAIAAWGVHTWRSSQSLRAALRYPPVMVAGLGGTAALAAAPVDQMWHARFGRDAVLWSPPHMLVVFASSALIAGLIAGVPLRRRAMRWAASILLLGNAIAVVFEYETDVPQFSETLYLPIFLATGLAVAWVARTAVPTHAPVTTMVLGYAVLRLGIAAVLAILGRSGPDLPVAVLGLALVDLPLARAVQRYAAGAVGASVLGWAAAAAGLSSQSPDAVSVVAVPTIVAGALIVAAGGFGSRGVRVAEAVMAMIAVAVTFAPAPARAHDPGQGASRGPIELAAISDGAHSISMRATVSDGCAGLAASRLVARRAGVTVSGVLRAEPGCVFSGRITVPAGGRWFVYVELLRDGQILESWLAVPAGRSAHIVGIRELYLPVRAGTADRPVQIAAGAVLYLLGLTLLVAAANAVRRMPGRPTAPFASG
ncbi:hypothetical protein [Mycolicibacterium chlorophenolicum]|uniref:Uncharacterized protein n=1 Tax=Mycolicibacterium chlorophenolicum TaxID=37916 RepID=A0A0J6VVG4_9MYCO|nr:hypothetical protein [Mycolicibacterium chlorophenolicum]KMO73488.1 hypothetical protein MCHLDSM_03834 [Mycolicibacterium chlorophenolicum]